MLFRTRFALGLAAAMLGAFPLITPPDLSAQGVLLIEEEGRFRHLPRPISRPEPVPEATYRVKELAIDATVTDQAARIQLTQTFQNTGSQVVNAAFVFPLPPDAAIDNLTLLVDGREFQGKLMPKEEARKIYEDYVRRSQDPALLEWLGGGMFQTSVFPIPPGAERKVTLEFTQLLRRVDRSVELLLPLATAKYSSQPLDSLSMRIAIETSQPLKNLYCPAYQVSISRSDEKHAVLTYEAKSTVPAADLRLFFDSGDQLLGASMLSTWETDDDQGHFLLLVSPEFGDPNVAPLPKDVVLVIDRSGSMSGKKIEQVRESLKFVIERLNDGDRFNIVSYSGDVDRFRPELEFVNSESRAAALGYAEGIYAGGSTNISEALTTALPMLADTKRPSYLVFLTDGLPTAGETDETKIVQLLQNGAGQHVRAISLGVGYDVNSRLLDRIADHARGRSEYVRPEENIEAYVARLYSSIASPIMTDVKLSIEKPGREESAGPLVNQLQPAQVFDLFQGEQLVVAGRHRDGGDVRVTVTGNVGDVVKSFEFPLKLAARSENTPHRFVSRIWASRRIGQIINELDLRGKNDELVEELVGLSMRYGIMTPYTSFLADDQPTTLAGLGSVREFSVEAESRLGRLNEAGGRGGFDQRRFRSDLADEGSQAIASGPVPSGSTTSAGGGSRPGAALAPASAASTPSDAFGFQAVREIGADQSRVVDTVRNIAGVTLYRRGDLWVAANVGEVDPAQLPDSVKKITRYSEEYFQLASENSTEENTVLSRFEGSDRVLIKLRGQLVLVE